LSKRQVEGLTGKLLALGDLTIQGNIKAVLSADIMERVDPIFYGDPLTAAMKALGM